MVAQSTADTVALAERIATIEAEAGAELGVMVRHVQTGVEVTLHPDSLYPMASVFKVPILVEALTQVDQGALGLHDRHTLQHEDKPMGSGVLVTLEPGLQPTLHDLLMLMIIVSDNTATDMVLRLVGVDAVDRRMKALGLDSIRIRMSVQGLFDASYDVPEGFASLGAFWTSVTREGPLVDPLTGIADERVASVFRGGLNPQAMTLQRTLENNVSSPRAMARLFELLVMGQILTPESTRVALSILLSQQLNARLPRYLPSVVPIAHKTGTFGTTRNDAGIIYLPDSTHLVVVTFAILDGDRSATMDADAMRYVDGVDAAMGLVARAAFDSFAGEPAPGA